MKTKINETNTKSWIFKFLCNVFQLLHWRHFKAKSHDQTKPYYTIIEIRGFRKALIDTYFGERSTIIF